MGGRCRAAALAQWGPPCTIGHHPTAHRGPPPAHTTLTIVRATHILRGLLRPASGTFLSATCSDSIDWLSKRDVGSAPFLPLSCLSNAAAARDTSFGSSPRLLESDMAGFGGGARGPAATRAAHKWDGTSAPPRLRLRWRAAASHNPTGCASDPS